MCDTKRHNNLSVYKVCPPASSGDWPVESPMAAILSRMATETRSEPGASCRSGHAELLIYSVSKYQSSIHVSRQLRLFVYNHMSTIVRKCAYIQGSEFEVYMHQLVFLCTETKTLNTILYYMNRQHS